MAWPFVVGRTAAVVVFGDGGASRLGSLMVLWRKRKMRGGVNCDEDEIEDDDETLKTRIRLKRERGIGAEHKDGSKL